MSSGTFFSASSGSSDDTNLDAEIISLRSKIRSLQNKLSIKEKLKRDIMKKKKMKRDAKTKKKESIITKASDRLKYGTKIYNKPCSETDYKKGKKLSGLICSLSDDGHRYRPVGNPGDVHFSKEDVVRAAGHSYITDFDGKPVRRFNDFQIGDLRVNQIKEYEKVVKENLEHNIMKPGGPAERMMGHWSKKQTLRKAKKEFEKEFGSSSRTASKSSSNKSKGKLKKGKKRKGKKKKKKDNK